MWQENRHQQNDCAHFEQVCWTILWTLTAYHMRVLSLKLLWRRSAQFWCFWVQLIYFLLDRTQKERFFNMNGWQTHSLFRLVPWGIHWNWYVWVERPFIRSTYVCLIFQKSQIVERYAPVNQPASNPFINIFILFLFRLNQSSLPWKF